MYIWFISEEDAALAWRTVVNKRDELDPQRD
jgi:hypothetical protein